MTLIPNVLGSNVERSLMDLLAKLNQRPLQSDDLKRFLLHCPCGGRYRADWRCVACGRPKA